MRIRTPSGIARLADSFSRANVTANPDLTQSARFGQLEMDILVSSGNAQLSTDQVEPGGRSAELSSGRAASKLRRYVQT
jgi:hypothetical protein